MVSPRGDVGSMDVFLVDVTLCRLGPIDEVVDR
jgi:hypothetical protein